MNENALSRWTGLAGLATVILALVAFAVFGTMSPPTESDSGQTIAKFFAGHRTTLAVLVYLIALSLGCNLAFFVGLRDVFRRRAPDSETLVTVGAIGGIVFIAVVYVGFGVLLQLVYREDKRPGAGRSGPLAVPLWRT